MFGIVLLPYDLDMTQWSAVSAPHFLFHASKQGRLALLSSSRSKDTHDCMSDASELNKRLLFRDFFGRNIWRALFLPCGGVGER